MSWTDHQTALIAMDLAFARALGAIATLELLAGSIPVICADRAMAAMKVTRIRAAY
jgi:hypothetical protein